LLVFLREKMAIFNQYSAIWISVVLVVIAGVILLRRKPKWPQITAFVALVVGLATAWLFLHPHQTVSVMDAAQVQGSIGQGTPVLLEFQSPY
jgi:hypothetical protein